MIINKLLKIFALILGLQMHSISWANEMNLLFIGAVNTSSFLGAKQGLTEAELMGEFLGLHYNLDNVSINDLNNIDASKYTVALLAINDPITFTNVAKTLKQIIIFNTALTNDSLRENCINNVFHTIPSEKMLQDAEQQYRQKYPESIAIAQAWHHDFVKFAARDLNKRYKASTGKNMDDAAWAAWAAVKLVTDSTARLNSTDPKKLLDYLKTSLLFDGQKGSDMNFRETGQLRQPLLLIEDSKIVTEAPVRGVSNSLDSMGILSCKTKNAQ